MRYQKESNPIYRNNSSQKWGVGLGMIALAITLGSWLAPAQPTYSDQSVSYGAGAELITHFHPLEGGGPTQVTLIDPRTRVMTVYHIANIGEEKGRILLKSVRPFRWDMELDSHNTGEPLPQDIRGSLERRQ
jgi:hypothetical protein